MLDHHIDGNLLQPAELVFETLFFGKPGAIFLVLALQVAPEMSGPAERALQLERRIGGDGGLALS